MGVPGGSLIAVEANQRKGDQPTHGGLNIQHQNAM
jgi:hypothetical protein